MQLSLYNSQSQKQRRQELRKNQTEAEKVLWQKLRGRKLNGLKFHRQYSVGPYILDFFCPQIRLAIELDGDQHKNAVEYDKERDTLIGKADIKTLRFWNNEIFNDMEKVLEKIYNESKINNSKI